MLPRAALLLAVALLAGPLGACGRRGPLEAPGAVVVAPGPRVAAGPAIEGQANAPGQAQVDDGEPDQQVITAAPIPAAPRGPRRAITVPQTPFFLDPLL